MYCAEENPKNPDGDKQRMQDLGLCYEDRSDAVWREPNRYECLRDCMESAHALRHLSAKS